MTKLFVMAMTINALFVPNLAKASSNIPSSIDFTFSSEFASNLANKEFCRVTASTETYNHFYGASEKSESLSLSCDGQTVGMSGRVALQGGSLRVDQILGQAMSQLIKLGFKVVTCETNKRFYSVTCTVAKNVLVLKENTKAKN